MAYALLVCFLLTHTLHSFNLWMAVVLAVIRYIYVCRQVMSTRKLSLGRAKLTVVAVFVVTCLICIPIYQPHIVKQQADECFLYEIENGRLDDTPDPIMLYISIVHRILPCSLLACFSTLLIIKIQNGIKRRDSLFPDAAQANQRCRLEHSYTTRMLLAFVICTFIMETPNGILLIISAFDIAFRENVYFKIGNMLVVLALINSFVNLMIYCSVSKQFRVILKNVITCKPCSTQLQNMEMSGFTRSTVHYTSKIKNVRSPSKYPTS